MLPDLPTRLARKWCAYCAGKGDCSPDAHHYHGAIAAAVREALEEPRKALEEIVKGEGAYNRDPLVHCSNTVENLKEIARAAIAVLRK